MPDATLNSLLSLRTRFLSFIERRVPSSALAEDILQTAYLRALTAPNPPSDQTAAAWFYSILRNAIIDSYRRRSTEDAALALWARELEGSTAPPPELEQAICGCITGALDLLKPAYASLLRQIDLGESDLAAYARAEGITRSNATVRAHRARAALRKELTRCCGACATHGCLDCTCKQT